MSADDRNPETELREPEDPRDSLLATKLRAGRSRSAVAERRTTSKENSRMTVTYGTTHLNHWNRNRRGEYPLDLVAAAYLRDPDITDRDRIAFALRELRNLGYDVEACPVDWTKPKMICSLEDSIFDAFRPLTPSRHHRRLQRIADRIGVPDGELLFAGTATPRCVANPTAWNTASTNSRSPLKVNVYGSMRESASNSSAP